MGHGVSWRFVNAAVRGTSHERTDVPCQDDCFVDLVVHDTEEVLLAIASDGAGSASCAEEGSGLVCETLWGEVQRWLRDGGRTETLARDVVEQWIGRIRQAIETRAVQKELAPRHFACTLVAAIIGTGAAVFLQIGDGGIVTANAGEYQVIFWPDGGEYANMTFFVTDDDWTKHLHFELRHVAIEDLAVITDGLQRLALRFESRDAHGPFFKPMFQALAGAPLGFASELEPALVAFLGSEAINARTDDDKSIVLATRRAGATHGTV
jgi:hypothetical protein